MLQQKIDKLLDSILSFIIPDKEKIVERVTFNDVLLKINKLTETIPMATQCKVFIIYDENEKCYRIAAFPVDEKLTEYYDKENVICEVFIARNLDDKLYSLMQQSKNGKFIIPIKNNK